MPARIPYHRPPGASSDKALRDKEYNQHGRDKQLLRMYSTSAWQAFRAWVKVDRKGLCERCMANGRLVNGEHVHHLIDPRERPDLILEPSNVELWCMSCHSSHHASERGKGKGK
jgi:5-methylcytosine-specific restriction protein A